MTASAYPAGAAERSRWILERRGPRNELNPERPHAWLAEEELSRDGRIVRVATVFLTGRECPWRCAMCDLWRNTTARPPPAGAIARQIAHALASLPPCAAIKLYNSGSFFDSGAIRPSEWPEIARLCRGLDVIVECHPRLVDERAPAFASLLDGRLEIALGLETAHPAALEAINKRFTPGDFQNAAAFLARHAIDLRSFLLVHPPFIEPGAELEWLGRSLRFAFDCGSAVVSLIPLRHGNGAIEQLAPEPPLAALEEAQEIGLRLGAGRVFADCWDLARFARCASCAAARAGRIHRMNLSQRLEPRVACQDCAS